VHPAGSSFMSLAMAAWIRSMPAAFSAVSAAT
jgi:hypothetical protein